MFQQEYLYSSAARDGVERAAWSNKFEFILTIVGLAVGLGNLWRFPYLCYRNGGGAFLIPYFGSLFLLGIPIFLLEMAVGQFCGKGPIGMWSLNMLLKGSINSTAALANASNCLTGPAEEYF
ncbi:hypothetical protein HELRODRAFT_179367 [Helobdella robusta]|uniref:Transporter n=1 Tax=Helobdella robusta TaxID=6412 RepID=T1FEM1_HELRO|nr:hypothetical protein HELRODRAFT_179367 [Helobdella robusta]ESN95589.1 hypothetical protein HELRODRAFT_179367 [Helobdella robusta]